LSSIIDTIFANHIIELKLLLEFNCFTLSMAMFFDIILRHGEVSEWLKEHAWKVCKRL
jgi:hypothetical protein